MFLRLLDPRRYQAAFENLHDSNQLVELVRPKTAKAGDLHGIKPDFCFAILSSHMHMRRLGKICLKKTDSESVDAKNGGHGKRMYISTVFVKPRFMPGKNAWPTFPPM
jgi:hypothetical protein